MCLIVVAYKCHKDYKLIFASNRDEAYIRPTQDAHKWETNPNMIAGKDLEHGGTWLGLSETGLLSAVTNYRDPKLQAHNKLSRGFLITDFVLGNKSAEEYLNDLDKKSDEYNGFNLFVGNPDDLYYYSNVEKQIKKVEAGIHGLSNHLLDTPWEKVKYVKKGLEEIISDDFTEEDIFKLLRTDKPFSEDLLPDTGVGINLEKVLSPLFIKTSGYGTRCSTIITIDYNNKATFTERVYDTDSNKWHDNKFTFKIADNT